MATDTNAALSLLIVDDSRVSRMMIRAFVMDKHPEWVIAEATTGNDAIAMVDKQHFDYCTMDINMPGMLGTDAAAQILINHPNLRIAIFSANIQEVLRTRAADLGAQFVAKPVTEKSVDIAIRFFKGDRV